MYFPDRFDRRNVEHFSESYIVFLIVSVSGNCIRSRTEYKGLGSTHPCIILWSKGFSSLNSNYVYNEVAFYGGELEGDVL